MLTKKVLPFILAVGVGVLVFGLSGAGAEVVESTVGSMSAEEINGPAQPDTGPVSNPPVLTAQMVRDIVILLRSPEQHNGLSGIARIIGCSPGQVKQVKRAIQARLRELAPVEVLE